MAVSSERRNADKAWGNPLSTRTTLQKGSALGRERARNPWHPTSIYENFSSYLQERLLVGALVSP
jgi:hypothetical protein